eukprot:363000-Chlamydomonas_euryale.AAC.4
MFTRQLCLQAARKKGCCSLTALRLAARIRQRQQKRDCAQRGSGHGHEVAVPAKVLEHVRQRNARTCGAHVRDQAQHTLRAFCSMAVSSHI